ncbi:hypothetical protein [Candidatus Mycalebacterium sp.]
MKKFLVSVLFLFFCVLPASAQGQMAESGQATGSADLPIVQETERDPRTFCPYQPGFSNEHLLIFIDVTDGFTEQQINLMKNDILTEKLLENVEIYGKVSLIVMDGNEPVTKLTPLLSVCRPKNGNNTSKDKRDHFDLLIESRQRLDLEYRIGYLRRIKEKVVEIIQEKAEKNREPTDKTPLMEAIHEITRSSAIDFDDKYEKKTLLIVSNMYHNSKSLPLDKLCVKRIYRQGFAYSRYKSVWKCPSFKDVKSKRANEFYLERKIKPKFKGETDIKLWILYREQGEGSIRDSSLLTFWEDYFIDYVAGDVTFLEPEFEPDPFL